MNAYTAHPTDLRRACEAIDPNLYPGHPATRDHAQKWVTFTYETRNTIVVLHHFTGPNHGWRISQNGEFVYSPSEIRSPRARRAIERAHAMFPITGD